MESVILGLGSNQGDSKAILTGALRRLSALLTDMRTSSLYRTAPQEYTAQKDFYNLAVSGGYMGTCISLLQEIQKIEKDYGRQREFEIPKGPRTLDIDIIFFGTRSVCFSEPPLIIPHPAVRRRAFVLIPLLELHPDYADPLTGEPLVSVLAALPDQNVRKSNFLIGTAIKP